MSSIAPIHFIFGQQRDILILYKIHDLDLDIFNNYIYLWSIMITIGMIELGFVNKKSDHFSHIVVFGKQELQLFQQRCFHAKEQTLSFSEHQKSLKSVHYS